MRISMTIAAVVMAAAAPALAQDFDLMGFADTDKDDKVSMAEFTAFQGQGWQFAANGADKIKPADLQDMMKPVVAGVPVDADGNVTAAAFTAYIPTRFKNADKDGDGALTKAELEASMGMPPSAG